jgi:hypothetical protein
MNSEGSRLLEAKDRIFEREGTFYEVGITINKIRRSTASSHGQSYCCGMKIAFGLPSANNLESQYPVVEIGGECLKPARSAAYQN